ncbi:hypothetical protein L484_010670 [Morus notabilis]|uniref:Uncharacterized protein n=1 Tax=Morus notabilis TaxID=981085 RepID=W9SAC6_9ROSA|nr:hypothetical protein L484_010670 [Morus notabilis]
MISSCDCGIAGWSSSHQDYCLCKYSIDLLLSRLVMFSRKFFALDSFLSISKEFSCEVYLVFASILA